MISVTGLVDALGPGLLRLVASGRDAQVHDVVLAEPGEAAGRPGEIVLGAGVTGPAEAVELLERAGAAGAAGVVLKAPLAAEPEVVEAARRLGPALIELQRDASWTHVIWLVRGAVDRAHAALPGRSGPQDDLFALADTAAEIADAPVTVEDARSRVLAYSGRQDSTDPARVSTIVGRRVPPQVIAHLRASGVFRKLARSSDPILVPEGPDGMLPRLVIPVRAGGEWLGSIWVVARTPIPPDRVGRLTDLASVLALHLLRLRAEAGVARRVSADQLRAALRDGTRPVPEPPPWRAVVLGGRDETEDVRRRLDLWDAVVQRFGWHRPLLTDLDGNLFAVVTEPPGRDTAGTMPWLRHALTRVRAHDRALYAAAGGLAHSPADLPRSRAEAAELAALITAGRLSPERSCWRTPGTPSPSNAPGKRWAPSFWAARSPPCAPTTRSTERPSSRPSPPGWTTTAIRRARPRPWTSTPTPSATG
ncbi:hypothetical protein LUW76_35770 [Actinomadura madurae]|uniref:hypothetical protein n=1 Tax=Actinomadura madurae TaxID=1993 RepID=UPI002025CDC3|nr:hypothetical protein [Actinomadura madurae]URM99256.1 hypothetical protein LUW76_35770 [Actinomadura madurae]